ncbi:hypothetical protein Glove_606g109 [Diversispora epigaea]|uniref:Uncharacterized protein n=1 Tax=Diversispora epigaea TaxID=1348612 RepID=A0A397GD03_9GLOM|nr:hypothetical protein Glove_606g109 [Diversispora epigaea]
MVLAKKGLHAFIKLTDRALANQFLRFTEQRWAVPSCEIDISPIVYMIIEITGIIRLKFEKEQAILLTEKLSVSATSIQVLLNLDFDTFASCRPLSNVNWDHHTNSSEL